MTRQSFSGCNACVITSRDVPGLTYDSDGVCNLCRVFQQKWKRHCAARSNRIATLQSSVEKLKSTGRGKPYDCVIGISGGVDSSYLAWKVIQLGLRPLAVHFDNGWNSELAVKNIESLTNALGIDLHTHVVDWAEFRDLQKAYLRASVIDIEVPTDHGIYGTLYATAVKHGVKFVLGGNNLATEGFMPQGWHFQKCDHINLLDIHRKYATTPLSTYPLYGRALKKKVWRSGIESLEILDLIEYSREEAVETITKEFGWRDYGTKHGESTFTKFYQEYVLPKKFGVIKRKAHLSTLINTGELTRQEAWQQLESQVYSESEMSREKEYVLKKLGFSAKEFDDLMSTPPVDHRDFETEGSLFYEYRFLLPFRPVWNTIRDGMGLRHKTRPTWLEIR